MGWLALFLSLLKVAQSCFFEEFFLLNSALLLNDWPMSMIGDEENDFFIKKLSALVVYKLMADSQTS